MAKIQKPWTKENQRANIQAFLDAVRAYGVAEEHLFKVEDLHEKTGIPNVTRTMIELGKVVSIRIVISFSGYNCGFTQL